MYMAAAFAGATGGINATVDIQTAVLTSKRFAAAGLATTDKQALDVREASQVSGVNVFREEAGKVLLGINRSTYQPRSATPGSRSPFEIWSETVTLDWIRIDVEVAVRPGMVAWATPEYVSGTQSKVMGRLRLWRDRRVITAGVDPDTGEAVRAFTVPRVVANQGAVYIYFDLGLAGEIDHARIKGSVRRVNVSAALAA